MDSFYQKPVSIMDDLNKCNTSDTHVDEVINKVFYCGLNSAVSLTGVLGNSLLLVIFVHPSLLPHKTLFHSYLKVGHHQSFKRRSIRRFIIIITEKAHTIAFYTVSVDVILERQHNYHIRDTKANRSDRPLWPLCRHPNFMSTYSGLTFVQHSQCLKSVLNVRALSTRRRPQ